MFSKTGFSFSKSAEEQNELFEKLQRKQHKLKEIKTQHNEQILRNTHLENALRSAQESQSSLMEKVQSLELCISEKNKQLTDLVEVIHEYENVIDDRQTLIIAKSEEVNRLTSDCNELQLKIKDLEEQCEYSFKDTSNSNVFETKKKANSTISTYLNNANNSTNDSPNNSGGVIGMYNCRAPWVRTHSPAVSVHQKSLADELIEADSEMQNKILSDVEKSLRTSEAYAQTDSLLQNNADRNDKDWQERLTVALTELKVKLFKMKFEKKLPTSFKRSLSYDTVDCGQNSTVEDVVKLLNYCIQVVSRNHCEPNPAMATSPNSHSLFEESQDNLVFSSRPLLNEMLRCGVELKRWKSFPSGLPAAPSELMIDTFTEGCDDICKKTSNPLQNSTFWKAKERSTNTTQTEQELLGYCNEASLAKAELKSWTTNRKSETEDSFKLEMELLVSLELKQLKVLTEELNTVFSAAVLSSSCLRLSKNDFHIMSLHEPFSKTHVVDGAVTNPEEQVTRFCQILNHISILVQSLTSTERLENLKSYQKLNVLQTLATLDTQLNLYVSRTTAQNVKLFSSCSDNQSLQLSKLVNKKPIQNEEIENKTNWVPEQLRELGSLLYNVNTIRPNYARKSRPLMQNRNNKSKHSAFILLGLVCVFITISFYFGRDQNSTVFDEANSLLSTHPFHWLRRYLSKVGFVLDDVNPHLVYPYGSPPL
ncbi:hypothetical protein FGIG_00088 [Fasciola gigantica]|uniref:Uncharacterized protein n=1 Tax=Fasciola gigantica TaxID=46835 RepID=A0A504YZU0_FASGI|nr:hypothetical protein FGIG_00088 [Fasciola gigantica]